jgi:PAS domain S-box-containing protein
VDVKYADATPERGRRLEARLRVLSEATHAFAEATIDPRRLLETVVAQVAAVVEDSCLALLLSKDGRALTLEAAFDRDPDVVRQLRDVFATPFLLEEHPVGRRVHETGEPFLAPKLDLTEGYPGTTPTALGFMQRLGIHSMLIVALRVREQSVGQLVLIRFRPDSPPFDHDDLLLAQNLADHAALAMSNAHLLAESRREHAERKRVADRLALLTDAAKAFGTATADLDQLLDVTARRLGDLLGDLCVIRLVSEDGAWLEQSGAVHHPDPDIRLAARVTLEDRQPVGVGFMGRVAATGQAFLVSKTDTATILASAKPAVRPLLARIGVTSAMAVPLLCRGKVVGIAALLRSRPDDPYGQDDLGFVQSLADHAGLAVGNARSFENARASELRYRQMFDKSPLPKWMYDAETLQLLDANDAAVRDYGYSREEFRAMRIPDIRVTDDEAAFRASVLETTSEQTSVPARHRKKNGETIEVEIIRHSFALGGRKCGIAVATDVTERHRLEDQLRQAQKMEAVGRLAGGVAHDFNNALSVILTYGEVMLSESAPGDRGRSDVEEIMVAAQRAADLTRQLLMFSRRQVLAPRVVDLNEVLASMDKMLQRILGADVNLVSVPSRPLGRVCADPSSLQQVIMNLVVNARDAMPTGGKLTMETADVVLDEAYAHAHVGVKPGPHVMLAVTDTGGGMDGATLARIFEPFFTTKEAGKGTGLGLSTVFGVVQQSGGSVWVYSEVGKGTCFKVYLPRVDAPADLARETELPTTSRGTETILLVEDDQQVRTVARDILQRSGYAVLEARNGGQALVLSEGHAGTIHLLLTDVVMPQMSGPALAKRLAHARPDMKVLCMSGYTDDSIVRHGVLEAEIDFIQKPITPGTLTRKVRAVLDGRGHAPASSR